MIRPTRHDRLPRRPDALGVLVLLALLGGPGRPALGQARVRDFTRPFVALRTGGHQAPVKALVYTPDGRQLLSAGLDKVVQVHRVVGPRPGLVRTLHPPSWRGLRGAVYAMTLSPAADAEGRRRLAIGGVGVLGGEILLYRDPSPTGPPTGDLEAALPQHDPAAPGPTGHSVAVTGLAFTPDGLRLASSGADGRVLLWDVAARRVLAELSGPGPVPARTLALGRDGRFLAAGFRDGRVRVWDLGSLRPVAESGPWQIENPVRSDAEGHSVQALAFGPDGRWLVVGRENGRLVRVDSPFLLNPVTLPQVDPRRGPIEALAVAPDGLRLAVSSVDQRTDDPARLPRTDCTVALHRLDGPILPLARRGVRPDGLYLPPVFGVDLAQTALAARMAGSPQGPRFGTEGLVYAVAFRPDGRQLAFAGGDAQAVRLVDLDDPEGPAVRLRGEGSGVLTVGFSRDGRAVSLTRRRPDRPDLPPERLGFDLATRAVRDVAPDDLAPRPELPGWRIEPVGPFLLNARPPRPRAAPLPIRLDPTMDGRWWDVAFLPGSAPAGHPDDCLAVACDAGLAIYNLRTGERTRFLAGHSGIVNAAAPSPDGRWLATGSADQTLRLWRLAGCDRRPPLGATLDRGADGRWSVRAVAPLGFADAMGLQPGDVLEIAAISARPRPLDEVLSTLDALPPGTSIELGVRRGDQALQFVTTRRDSPALSLFVGEGRDWVLWMPQGYYDTLLAGDRRFLTWHRNGPLVVGPGAAIRFEPTDVYEAEKFEAEFRQPRVLEALFANADLGRALALVPPARRDPPALAESGGPPVVRILAPAERPPDGPMPIPAGNLTIRASISFDERSPLRRLHVQVEGQTVGEPLTFDPPPPGGPRVVEREFVVPVPPGRHRISLVAENAEGRRRVEGLDVLAAGPPPRSPTLAVLAVGAGGPFADPRIPPIPFADADADGLRAFLAAPGDVPRFPRVDAPAPLAGPSATAEAIRAAFGRLDNLDLGPGDAVLVALEAHVVADDSGRHVLGGDTTLGSVPTAAPTVDALGDVLAGLASRGCRVLLLLDGAHQPAPPSRRGALNAWARELTRRGVIVFLASQSGPGRRLEAEGQGAFAFAVIHAAEARSQSRPLLDPDEPMTLDDFQATVVDRVKELTGRRQFAACLLPETISPDLLLFDPPGVDGSTDEP